MGFEIAKLRRPPVSVEYKPTEDIKDGEGLQLKLNLDLLTMARLEEMEKEFETTANTVAKVLKKNDEPESESETEETEKISIFHFDKANIRFKARMLGGEPGENNPDDRYIADWNVEADGKPVPVCYETFAAMPATVLKNLHDFVTGEASAPTKKSVTP